AGAIVSGLDLLDDPSAKDMRDEAMELIASSARKLADQLSFARVAFGASAAVATFDVAELERLARGAYAHVRAELQWSVDLETLPKAPAQALLNLAQLAAGALPLGGLARLSARIEGTDYVLKAEGEGPKARLHAEVREGLAGEPLSDGLAGRWVQAYFVHALVTGAGGRIEAEAGEERIALGARLPI
ncbi:MAG: histidine phosphotransferase ChpT, partial [Caulobacteraceae bacterium]